MAHTRARSSTASSALGPTPHALSLKVLRLSRPSLAVQTPLPATNFGGGGGDGISSDENNGNGLNIPTRASLAYPQKDANAVSSNDETSTSASASGLGAYSTFPLTPLLTLPPAFGAAYVGEEFACTLCANHDAPAGAAQGEAARRVRDVRMTAEMLVPGQEKGVPVKMYSAKTLSRAHAKRADEHSEEGQEEDEENEGEDEAPEYDPTTDFPLGATLQRTLRYQLKDEGPHQLAVTVTYNELPPDSATAAATEGRTRTFKKLYQFVAQPLVAVRSKISERRRPSRRNNNDGTTNKRESGSSATGEERQWILEAQLENIGEVSVVLEKVFIGLKDGIGSVAVNERVGGDQENPPIVGNSPLGKEREKPAIVLKPSDVEQVMFILNELPGVRKVPEEEDDEDIAVGVGRIALAQVHVHWRAAMGERGSLTTGWLGTRRR